MTDVALGMRAAIRRSLYQTHRHDLGCPTSDECSLFASLHQVRPCGADNGCPKFLHPAEPYPSPATMPRVMFLVKTESMVNVGCKFGPNDLPYRVWEELMVLAQERGRMEGLIREQRDTATRTDRETARNTAAARKDSGLPSPGGSIFPGNVPK